jgi:hypothetical protein
MTSEADKQIIAEEKETAHEVKIVVLVFIIGIFASYVIQETYGRAYYKVSMRLTALSIYMLISAMIGRMIWNNYIITLFPFAKPAPGYEHILGLMLFSGLVLRF